MPEASAPNNKRRRLYVFLAAIIYMLLIQDVNVLIEDMIKKHQIINSHYEIFPAYAQPAQQEPHKIDPRFNVLMESLSVPRTEFEKEAPQKSNWMVIVGASRYFYNYRHTANALSMYRAAKKLGIPDDRVILMLADDTVCSPRNVFPGTNFNHRNRDIDLYGDDIEVDFRGDEVTVDSFLRVLSGRQPPWTSRKQRLESDENSRVFVYITGHSGDRFLKFRDSEVIGTADIAGAVRHMYAQKRYSELFFLSDTCQAATLQHDFDTPNVLAVASSHKDQSSYSHHLDREIGVAMVDRFSLQMWEVISSMDVDSTTTLHNLLTTMDPADLRSMPEVWIPQFDRNVTEVLLTDFFSNSEIPEVSSASRKHH